MSEDAVQKSSLELRSLSHECGVARQGRFLIVVDANPKLLKRTLNLSVLTWIKKHRSRHAEHADEGFDDSGEKMKDLPRLHCGRNISRGAGRWVGNEQVLADG